MKKLLYLLFAVAVLVSCNSSHNKKQKGLIITDTFQRVVTIDKVPTRIVSASPAVTEILFALGKEKLLIGRTNYCVYPLQVSAIPSIGEIIDPNLETIASLNPDLVIASTHFKKEMADKIQQMNVPIVVLVSQESFEGSYNMIRQVADIVDAKDKGDSIIRSMQKTVSEIEAGAKTVKEKPSVYYVIGFGKTGDFTAGGNTFISNMISMAGGVNIAQDVIGWSYSLEKLIQKDPDIILIHNGQKEMFVNTPAYKNLKAVKRNKVYEVDNNLFELTGPRLSEGLKTLFTLLHPEIK
jgi:iron complex transport system substrate-binding protein